MKRSGRYYPGPDLHRYFEDVYPFDPKAFASARHPSMDAFYSIEKFELPIRNYYADDQDMAALRDALDEFYGDKPVVHLQVDLIETEIVTTDEGVVGVPALFAIIVVPVKNVGNCRVG